MVGRVYVEKQGAVGWLVFDHLARRNAITVDMWRAIPGAVASLEADVDVRVIALRGAGEVAFISGADISEFEAQRSAENAAQYEADNVRAFAAIRHASKPTVAMIHGFCVGGGVGIAVAADLRYAADNAQFAIPAARLGLGYPVAGVENLTSIVGYSAAKELVFTAKRFAAREALSMGLVNAVYPSAELKNAVDETLNAIAQNAPLTLSATKIAIDELLKPETQRDLARVEAAAQRCFDSEDYLEGVAAFLGKRAPRFQGR